MQIIFAGPRGQRGIWTGQEAGARLVLKDDPSLYGFARLSAFHANGNHAPSGAEGAVTSDLGLALLGKIAGVR